MRPVIVPVYGSVVLLLAVARYRWQSAIPELAQNQGPPARGEVATARVDSSAIDSLVDRLVANDPFRLANEPAAMRFDPRLDASSAATGPRSIPRLRPALTLKAIVGGPPWQAIVDGLPGQPAGTIVRTGDVFDQLSIAAITRETVTVRGTDTTWVLNFKARP